MHRDISTSSLAVIALVSVFVSSVSYAEEGNVYKQVDPEGNVTYTDKPPSADAKAMKVPKGTEYTPPKIPTFTPTPDKPKPTVFRYDFFKITAPANDESIWDNTGNITASVEFEPFLQTGHQIQFVLDGTQLAIGAATSTVMPNVDRGTHTLTAQIVDATGNALETATVIFHAKRHSKK